MMEKRVKQWQLIPPNELLMYCSATHSLRPVFSLALSPSFVSQIYFSLNNTF